MSSTPPAPTPWTPETTQALVVTMTALVQQLRGPQAVAAWRGIRDAVPAPVWAAARTQVLRACRDQGLTWPGSSLGERLALLDTALDDPPADIARDASWADWALDVIGAPWRPGPPAVTPGGAPRSEDALRAAPCSPLYVTLAGMALSDAARAWLQGLPTALGDVHRALLAHGQEAARSAKDWGTRSVVERRALAATSTNMEALAVLATRHDPETVAILLRRPDLSPEVVGRLHARLGTHAAALEAAAHAAQAQQVDVGLVWSPGPMGAGKATWMPEIVAGLIAGSWALGPDARAVARHYLVQSRTRRRAQEARDGAYHAGRTVATGARSALEGLLDQPQGTGRFHRIPPHAGTPDPEARATRLDEARSLVGALLSGPAPAVGVEDLGYGGAMAVWFLAAPSEMRPRLLGHAYTLTAMLRDTPRILSRIPRAEWGPLLQHPDRAIRTQILAALGRPAREEPTAGRRPQVTPQ